MKKALDLFLEHFSFFQLTMGNQKKKINYSVTVQVMAQSLTELSYVNPRQTIIIQSYIYDL